MRVGLLTGFLLTAWSVPLFPQPLPLGRAISFSATAYSLEGPAASGNAPRLGTVAADTDVLPIGTQIRISHAGVYSGIYTVTDTGRKVQGRVIDLYLPTTEHARQFGKKSVRVTVLKWGGKP